MLALQKTLDSPWEVARVSLRQDLDTIQTVLNRRWGQTFGASNTLSPTSGGTGAGTFTQGSVLFAGPVGVYTQNNTKFFWDNTAFSLNITGRGWFTGVGTAPVVLVRAVDASDAHSPLVVQRYSDNKSTLYIDSSGGINLNSYIRMCGNLANMGTVNADGTFTPTGAVANGFSAMLDMYSDTDLIWAGRVSTAIGAYAAQILDPSGNFVLSIESNGALKFGAGATYASEDTTFARTAAGKMSITGTTPMLQLGGTSSAFPAWKRSGATMMCRLADDSGYAELDVATIHPAATFDFRLKQNGVDVIFSKESTAVGNTLTLEAGKVGIGVSPALAKLHVQDGSGHLLAGNNSFGSDWVVLSPDTALASTKYMLACSLSGLTTIVNGPTSSGLVKLDVNNAEIVRVAAGGVSILTGAAPTAILHLKAGTATASTAPLKFISGTSLTTAEAGAMEFTTDDFFLTITTGAARKGIVLDNGARLTSGKIPVATTNGRLIDSTAALLTAGGVANIVASTFEKAETGTDANVLTYTTNASTDEFLVVQVATDVSALTGTSVAVTVTWKDSNNATATSTITLSAVGDGSINVPINAFKNTNVVVSTVFVGVSTAYNISAFVTRLK